MSIGKVHHLNCGTMCPLGAFLLGQRGLGRGRLVAHCVVLETERDGLVLIDTGFGTRDVERQTPVPRSFKAMVAPQFDIAETAKAQSQPSLTAAHQIAARQVAGALEPTPDARAQWQRSR